MYTQIEQKQAKWSFVLLTKHSDNQLPMYTSKFCLGKVMPGYTLKSCVKWPLQEFFSPLPKTTRSIIILVFILISVHITYRP